ncbi:MAG: hypothetical protein ACR2QM_02105 [Longimicrobiales bacterium]
MDWREKLTDLKAKLEQQRDELRVKGHLAKMDAKDELGDMEGKWDAFKQKMSDIDFDDLAEDAAEAAGKLGEELREGYDKLRGKIG